MAHPRKVNLTSSDLTAEKQAELHRILPEAFSEGKIDWEKLRAVLGDKIDERIEKFSFTWAGKSRAIQNVLIPSKATLRPDKKASVKFDESENLFIEGDNLEVLKLLKKAYFEQVKVIYIDPPYNTGGDFVYRDDFAAPLDTYLKQTGQKDGNGESLTTNKETSGRYHSDWLSMMYPRLKLAWSLLRDDGVIFVSIDDNEAHHLRMLMDEVFGEENFVGEFVVVRAEGGGLAQQYVKGHDYLLVYAKTLSEFEPLRRPKDIRGKVIEKDGKKYWIEEDWLRREFGKYGTLPYGEIEQVKGARKKAEIDEGLKRGEYTLIKKNGTDIVGRLRLIEEDGSKFYSVLKHLSASGNDDLQELEMDGLFDFPKPVSLLKEIILGATFFSKNNKDIILDFFAGSCTTAQAVMSLNADDGGNRKWICIQLPETLDVESNAYKAGYKTIADVAQERVRRAIIKVGTNDGFKVFRLGVSNYVENQFEFDPEKSEAENQKAFEAYLAKAKQAMLFDETNPLDVIYENIVKEGFSLNSNIAVGAKGNNKIYTITDGARQFSICLDRKIDETTVKNITEWAKGTTFICLDDALDDTGKANLSLSVELKTI